MAHVLVEGIFYQVDYKVADLVVSLEKDRDLWRGRALDLLDALHQQRTNKALVEIAHVVDMEGEDWGVGRLHYPPPKIVEAVKARLNSIGLTALKDCEAANNAQAETIRQQKLEIQRLESSLRSTRSDLDHMIDTFNKIRKSLGV